MCFGRKPQPDPSAVGARPAAQQQPQPQQTVSIPEAKPAASGRDQYQPPSGPPPPSSTAAMDGVDNAPPSGPPPGRQNGAGDDSYAPPPGPPPGHNQAAADNAAAAAPSGSTDYAPPPGPPPSHAGPDSGADYAPPPGPPPPSSAAALDYTAPPPGSPPPKQEQQQHNWQAAVPDTSLFPPPPDLFSSWERSPANNATVEEMEAGEAWCAQYPLGPPILLNADARAALAEHNPRLMQPVGFNGTMRWVGRGRWEVRTAHRDCSDTTTFAYPPLYCAREHAPARRPITGGADAADGSSAASSSSSKTIYYEVAIRPDSRPEETSLALGYAALPYPPFRLPGWHRGSLAVHGDDGHRYTNDLAGGISFTAPLRRGERYGIGMTFTATTTAASSAAATGSPPPPPFAVDVFFTRNGRLEGRWDLHEETDIEQSSGVEGLEGLHDLSCAIGTFNLVSFEVIFDPAGWMYKQVQV